jgi:hypothetical protein
MVAGLALSASALAATPEEPVTVNPAASVTASTATLEGVLNPNAAGEAGEYEFFYKASASECTEGSVAPEPAGVALGLKEEHVSVAVSGLAPGTQYTFCVFERNAAEETAIGQPVSFTTQAVAPAVSETFATGVSAEGATLDAVIVPGAASSTYRFEYGTTTAYGQSTPESTLIGAAEAAHRVNGHIQGLQPGTAYHYRVVAANSAAPGGIDGPDRTFTSQSSAGTSGLPDDRGYELVTPANKVDGTLPAEGTGYLGFQAAASGDGFAFRSFAPFPGALGGGFDTYLAARGGDGWSSHGILPSQAPVQVAGTGPVVDAYSPDLSKAALMDGGGARGAGLRLGQDSPPLVPGEPANHANLFLRDDVSGGYQLMDVTPAGLTPEAPAMYEGASADFSKVLFGEGAQLTPEALASGGEKFPNTGNLFQWAGGAVTLVGQVPVAPATRCGAGAAPCSAPEEGAILGGGEGSQTVHDGWVHAVSPDGSRVFFRTGNSGASQLYVRENGATTVEYSASQKTNGSGPGGTDPQGPRLPTYWPASADGSQAFFTSCEQLTNDSTANASESNESCEGFGQERNLVLTGSDLYRFDVATGVLSDLTVDHNGDPLGADVQAVLGASTDGSYVYFVANGVLASGASPGNCQFGYTSAEMGQCNLYVEHGGVTKFIGPIAGTGRYYEWSFHATTARVTQDGTKLAFETTASATGYDNRIGSGAESCGRRLESAGTLGEPTGDPRCSEVYMYDAVAGSLACVSCNPSGARPLGPSHLTPIEGPSEGGYLPYSFVYLPRSLSADGSRLFFDSVDALVPGDGNGQQDVYEYEGGTVYLVSSGTSGSESTFLDASADGSDVFFTTLSQLVGQDADQQFDIYDARVGGGFPFNAPPPGCVGEACKAPPAPQPGGATLGSNSLAGVANLTPVPAPSVASTSARHRKLTRAQKLAAALRVCRHRPRRQRGSCVARAHRLYGAVKAGKSTKSARGSK